MRRITVLLMMAALVLVTALTGCGNDGILAPDGTLEPALTDPGEIEDDPRGGGRRGGGGGLGDGGDEEEDDSVPDRYENFKRQ